MLRDEHRLREKIDLSLDERQVAPLALAVLILFGAVFAVGVFVGKSLASSAPPAQPIGNLDQLDARKDAPVAKPAADDGSAKAEAEQKRAEAEKAKADKAAADKAAREEQARAAQARAAEEKSAREKAEKDRKERERKKAEAREKALAAAAAAREHAGSGSAEADEGSAAGEYVVQLGSLPTRDEADRIAAKAKAAGMEASVVEANLGEKGTWYRVRVGGFADKAAAEEARAQAEEKLGGKPVVMQAR